MCVAAARVGTGEYCPLELLQPICLLHSSWVASDKTDHLAACAVSLFTWRGLMPYPSSGFYFLILPGSSQVTRLHLSSRPGKQELLLHV